ncbi:MAG: SUF system Fe-S cluster assembly protein [Planctomycetota bacterium]
MTDRSEEHRPVNSPETEPAASEGSQASPDSPAASTEGGGLYDDVVTMLKTVFDPEIPVNIYELGMIYHIDVDADSNVHVRMTLTSPNCPVAGSLPGEVQQKVQSVEGVTDAKVELVWDPPWTPELMSEAARLELGMY